MNIFFSLLFFSILLFSSCDNNTKSNNVIVSVYDKNLYYSDLVNNCGPFMSKEDSVTNVNFFIDQWIKEQLLLNQAIVNLSNDSFINVQVDNYRNQLLKYTYQKNMIASKLDTIVSENEITTFYEENSDDFILNEDIVKLRYAVIDVNSPDLIKFESIFIVFNDIDYLNKYCLRNSKEYHFNDSIWISVSALTHKLKFNAERFNFEVNKLHSIDMGDFYFYYFLNDFIAQSERSPIDYSRVKIIDVILRDRIKIFLNKLENDIFELELSNNNIKYY